MEKINTETVLLYALGGLLAYELWTVFNKIPGDTISQTFWRVSKDKPQIPFACGLLAGHLFWRN